MIRKRWVPAIAATALCSSIAVSQERSVTKVTVDEVGLSIEPDDPEMARRCKAFRPTVAQVKRYFSKAYPVGSAVITTERYSPCVANGTVEFTDNNTGRGSGGKFQVRSSGTATLWWDMGDVAYFLHKNNRWNDPLACTYGLDDEKEC